MMGQPKASFDTEHSPPCTALSITPQSNPQPFPCVSMASPLFVPRCKAVGRRFHVQPEAFTFASSSSSSVVRKRADTRPRLQARSKM